jgi:hypothetical protein
LLADKSNKEERKQQQNVQQPKYFTVKRTLLMKDRETFVTEERLRDE